MKVFRLFVAVTLVCFAPVLISQAVSPPPDGGYPNGNTAEGFSALFSLTSGTNNTALGFNVLYHDSTGNYNTGEGFRALLHNSTGQQNTATGANALFNNTTASFNTAVGTNALFHNTTGTQNTANGTNALYGNTTGNFNTGLGVNALYQNATGIQNTAVGAQALANDTASNNTAIGFKALFNDSTGSENTATGELALLDNTTGYENVANGSLALVTNSSGFSNTAIGSSALAANNMGSYNTAVGQSAITSNTGANGNTAIGYQALYSVSDPTFGGFNTAVGSYAGYNITGSGNVAIGANAYGESGVNYTTWISNVYTSVATARAVYVNSDGKIGTLSSSRRYKEQIESMENASASIFALRPVTFRYKNDVDPAQVPCFGLIAEEVANVSPDLVTLDKQRRPETVRYEAVNAMLLNEFLKEHKRVEEQQATIAKLKRDAANQKEISAQQQTQIDLLTAGLQKVSTQIEMSKAAPQTVLNNR